MRREEKRRQFHEAVLNTLYPPPASPPLQEEVDEKEPVNTLDDDFDVGLINPEDYVRSSTSSDDDDDGEDNEWGSQKLTRAQRKRLRKKKLKEDAARRRRFIGPLLPTTSEADKNHAGGGENDPPGVRQNADEECAVTRDKSVELSSYSNQKKIKQRRKAKRVARERLKLARTENNSQGRRLESRRL